MTKELNVGEAECAFRIVAGIRQPWRLLMSQYEAARLELIRNARDQALLEAARAGM